MAQTYIFCTSRFYPKIMSRAESGPRTIRFELEVYVRAYFYCNLSVSK